MIRIRRLALFAALASSIALPAVAVADDLRVMSFNVRTITGKDGVGHELHRDVGMLPKSRGCITGYRLFAVVTQQYAMAQSGVAIISTYPVGFEGPDRRFLAVPTNF